VTEIPTHSTKGRVGAGHVDALARLAGELDATGRTELLTLQPSLVATAATVSVEEFRRDLARLGPLLAPDHGVDVWERRRRQRSVRRWVDRVTGLCHTHLTLDPLSDAKVAAAFDAAVAAECGRPGDERSLEQLKADVIVDMLTGARHEHRRLPEVVVLIDEHSLLDGPHEHTVAETGPGETVPVASIRRLACDADLVPIVVDGRGVVLHEGRRRRHASEAQRRAMRAMYRTCGHPQCAVRFADCDLHHVTPWHTGGATDVHNLLPLCSKHHHLVHEGGWQLSLRPDRTIRLVRPDGSVAYEGSTIDVAPEGVHRDDGVTTQMRARSHNLAPPGDAA
jgi:hypothetical protein